MSLNLYPSEGPKEGRGMTNYHRMTGHHPLATLAEAALIRMGAAPILELETRLAIAELEKHAADARTDRVLAEHEGTRNAAVRRQADLCQDIETLKGIVRDGLHRITELQAMLALAGRDGAKWRALWLRERERVDVVEHEVDSLAHQILGLGGVPARGES